MNIIGSIDFPAGQTAGVFTTLGTGDEDFQIGDRLIIGAPTTASTLGEVLMMFNAAYFDA